MATTSTDHGPPLPPAVQAEMAKLIARLRRRQIQSPLDVARKTLEIMRMLVATCAGTRETADVSALIRLIKRAGAVMVAAQPHEVVIGNMVRRVLATVREEVAGGDGGGKAQAAAESAARDDVDSGGLQPPMRSGPSLMKLLDADDAPDYSRQLVKSLKATIIEGIAEVIDELSTVSAHIAEQAIEHIHANEVILTHGRDPTVEAFLKAAHKKRTFDVIVAETAPGCEGHETAVALSEAGISTTLIAVRAVISVPRPRCLHAVPSCSPVAHPGSRASHPVPPGRGRLRHDGAR